MNKYLKRGIILIGTGIAFNLIGWLIKDSHSAPYGWAMILGTLLFGIGFIYSFYSFMRKIEYQGVKEERIVNEQAMQRREEEKREHEAEQIREAS